MWEKRIIILYTKLTYAGHRQNEENRHMRRFVLFLTLCDFVVLVFLVLLALRLPHSGKRELILVLFVRLFDLRLFCFVCFLFLLVSGKGCSL